MKRFFSILLLSLSVFWGSFSFAQNMRFVDEGFKKFEFKYNEDDSYRVLSTVEEYVYFNGILHHQAEILNRVSVKVTDVDKENMTAVNHGTFMTTENSVISNSLGTKTFSYGEEYKSVYSKDRFGVFTIDDEYFMPTVRDVPVFPDKKIKPGDEWTYQGHEAHDLRRNYYLKKPYKVPFIAKYKYLGVYYPNPADKFKKVDDQKNEKPIKFDVFQVHYELSFELDTSSLPKNIGETPYKTTGFSNQLIFWDNDKGTIDHYTESFKIELTTTYGNINTFIGNSHAEVTEFIRTSTEENIQTVTQKINELGLENVNVRKTERGLTLSIENIQFKPESSVLLSSEKEKLNKLKDILSAYPNNDLLVTGHTALRGDTQGQLELSVARAEAVADYLIQIGVKDNYHIFTQGKGATEPLESNETESGRKKNRRVEITIMD